MFHGSLRKTKNINCLVMACKHNAVTASNDKIDVLGKQRKNIRGSLDLVANSAPCFHAPPKTQGVETVDEQRGR